MALALHHLATDGGSCLGLPNQIDRLVDVHGGLDVVACGVKTSHLNVLHLRLIRALAREELLLVVGQ